MIHAVLFDLGNTLVSYYQKEEFSAILSSAINGCIQYLVEERQQFLGDELWSRVKDQDYESSDYTVRPLEVRLSNIFKIMDEKLLERLCVVFMEPIFKNGKIYSDVEATLMYIREKGLKTAIISNTSWGSPSHLWKAELERYKLIQLMDAVVFCRDVGWRKPDPRIFHYALNKLGVDASECLFVGDDPRWDISGPNKVGIKSILIDRTGKNLNAAHSLNQIKEYI
jgi:putative hydrolase of the HAD superfamily